MSYSKEKITVWSAVEDDTLVFLISRFYHLDVVAGMLGRTKHAMRVRIYHLRSQGVEVANFWIPGLLNSLRCQYEDGKTLEQMAAEIAVPIERLEEIKKLKNWERGRIRPRGPNPLEKPKGCPNIRQLTVILEIGRDFRGPLDSARRAHYRTMLADMKRRRKAAA